MVARLARRVPNAEYVLELQPEELGGVIPYALVGDGGDVHLPNFVVGLRQPDDVYPRSFTDRIERAIGEAWSWLEAQGLIASTGDAWQFVMRRGKALAEAQAFGGFRKASLLQRGLLHPTLSASAWRSFIHGNYDTAVFEAFKAVEDAVRDAAATRHATSAPI